MAPRKVYRLALLAIVGVVAVVVLAAAAVAARLAVGPVSIMWLAPTIEEKLSERLYYAYRIEFDRATIAWRGGLDSVDVRFDSVRIRDYSSEVIATLPAISARGLPLAMLKGDGGIRSVRFEGPNIRWIESPGGAIRFDIGADAPGKSGKILEDFLITLASAPDPSADPKPLPQIEAVNTAILIADELTGTTYQISNAHITAEPDQSGVRADYEFDLALGSDVVHLTANSHYKTADQRIDLNVHFADVSPNALNKAVAVPAWLRDVTIPFSGIATFDMDRLFHIKQVDLEASGGGGGIAGTLRYEGDEAIVNGTIFMARRDAFSVADGWPSGIQGNGPNWLRRSREGSEALRVKVNGRLKTGELALSGEIDPDRVPVRISGTIDVPQLMVDEPVSALTH